MSISSYDYYRTSIPGWGTTQFQFRAPPDPAYQPRPTWSGWDYYRAHALNADPNLYYTVMNRTRDFGPTGGVGMHEARVWQRRVYSGIVSLTQLLPADIGVAAAYEAYRYWKHHNRMLFGPLGGIADREKEGIVALALAEASTLWQMSGRPMDAYGLRDCLESAALTATRIAHAVFEEQAANYDTSYGSGHRRYSSTSPVTMRPNVDSGFMATMGPEFASAPYDAIPGRAGSGSSGSYGVNGSPFGATSAMPIPGAGGSPYSMTAGLPYATGTSPYGSGYAGGVGSVPGAGMAGYGGGSGTAGALFTTSPLVDNAVGIGMPGASPGYTNAQYLGANGTTYPATGTYQPGLATGNSVQAYAGGSPNMYNVAAASAQAPYVTPQTYGTTTFPQGQSQAQVAYPQQQPYISAGASGTGLPTTTIIHGRHTIPAPAGSTIVIDTNRRRSRRSSHSGHQPERSRHRSRSVDPLRSNQPIHYAMAAR